MVLLATVADDRWGRKGGKYEETQREITRFFSEINGSFGIDKFLMWNSKNIITHPDYEKNKNLLDEKNPDLNPRLYKAMLVKSGMEIIKEGDFLIYNDTSKEIWSEVIGKKIHKSQYDINELKKLCVNNGGIIVTHARWNHNGNSPISVGKGEFGYHTHENFTSDRCMDIMNRVKYKYRLQPASGLIVLQKNNKTVRLVNEWEKYCKIDGCARSEGYAKNGKIGHRHDQSVLGLLFTDFDIPILDKLHADEQYIMMNPNNFLNYCQTNTTYRKIPSNMDIKDLKFSRIDGNMKIEKREI
jgi:hypothetical protein